MKNSEQLMKYWDGEFDTEKHVQILLWDRAIGKTEECITFLRKHKNAYCFIPILAMKRRYPRELHKRIFSVGSESHRGAIPRDSFVIFDDASLFPPEKLYQLYKLYNVVMITCSPSTFLQSLMMHNGISRKVNKEYQKNVLGGMIKW